MGLHLRAWMKKKLHWLEREGREKRNFFDPNQNPTKGKE